MKHSEKWVLRSSVVLFLVVALLWVLENSSTSASQDEARGITPCFADEYVRPESLKFYVFVLFLVELGLCCCVKAFSSYSKRGLLCCGAQASRCGGFSCSGSWASGCSRSAVAGPGLWSTGSVVVVQGLQLLLGTWTLPQSGIKPTSPALPGRFFPHWTIREVARTSSFMHLSCELNANRLPRLETGLSTFQLLTYFILTTTS